MKLACVVLTSAESAPPTLTVEQFILTIENNDYALPATLTVSADPALAENQEDRTPPPGIPAFRITVELPVAWQSYIANNAADVFDEMDPDDPWNRAAADREAAKHEKQGYVLLGPVIGAEAEFGRHEGTLGAITTYEAVNHDVLAGDDAAGMWRFRPAGSDAEHLILHRTEGVVWQRELLSLDRFCFPRF